MNFFGNTEICYKNPFGTFFYNFLNNYFGNFLGIFLGVFFLILWFFFVGSFAAFLVVVPELFSIISSILLVFYFNFSNEYSDNYCGNLFENDLGVLFANFFGMYWTIPSVFFKFSLFFFIFFNQRGAIRWILSIIYTRVL